MTDTLIKVDRKRLAELEHIIEVGKRAFLELGRALREIRDDRLYRESHDTFEAYIKERHGFARASAYRYIEAADVQESLSPIGDKREVIANESQYREIARVPAEDREGVIERAEAIAAERGSKLTAAVIREAATVDAVKHDNAEVWEDVVDEEVAKAKNPADYRIDGIIDHIKGEFADYEWMIIRERLDLHFEVTQ